MDSSPAIGISSDRWSDEIDAFQAAVTWKQIALDWVSWKSNADALIQQVDGNGLP